MSRWLKAALVACALVAVIEAGALAFLGIRARWQRQAGESAVVRGRAVAERSGCFACHGDGGARPIPNPGAKTGEVPSWTGGTWMMWNRNETDIRSWIERGRPDGREPDPGALIAMPAYGERLRADEIDDLVAFVLATSLFGWPEDPTVVAGREAAVKLGCFGCHGPEGRGLLRNPGSFKGYVPPWDGPDYPDLVQSDVEFREWVRDGITRRFRNNPVARRILESQAIRMPAYGDRITEEEIRSLLAFVDWVRENPRGAGTRVENAGGARSDSSPRSAADGRNQGG